MSRAQIINFVPQDNPGYLRKLLTGRCATPMRQSHILNPLNIANVADMTLMVNLIRLDRKRMLELSHKLILYGLLQALALAPSASFIAVPMSAGE